jgi:hypothetical protein
MLKIVERVYVVYKPVSLDPDYKDSLGANSQVGVQYLQ